MRKSINPGRRQRGLSTVGWIAVVGIFGLFVVTFFKVFPMYYGAFKVRSALQSMAQDAELDVKSKRALWDALSKRLFIDEVRSVTRDNVTMTRKDGKTTITVSYETRDDYIGNMFIGATFVESIVIDR
jgi:hypothetical protein